MYITSREKNIIELILKTSGKHTAFSISSYLDVSVRTVQRDLKSIEKYLDAFQLRLTRTLDKGLAISGKDEQVFKLVQHLMNSKPVDQTPAEKKLQALLILAEEESYKIQALASKLGVSVGTLTIYLDELSDWFGPFEAGLLRKRGVGIQLSGPESAKRKVLAHFFLQYFSEDLIDMLFLLEEGNAAQKGVLDYFHPPYLLAANQVVNATFHTLHAKLADEDRIGLIVHICITMQRAQAGFDLEGTEPDEAGQNELGEAYSLMKKICGQLEQHANAVFSQEDVFFLALILKGSKLQAAESVSYESIVLNQKVKGFIAHVSSQLHVNLTEDFSLYQGLLAHMEPSLFRMKHHMRLYNPLKEEIKRKYPFLFLAVKNSAEIFFPEIDPIPDDEIAYMVLHFGSGLVMKEEQLSIRALIVCPTGIGTSKMLASRVKKEFPEISSAEISSIMDLQQQENLKNYDVIISTVRLPFTQLDYILVSPLLTAENIETIRNFIQTNVGKMTERQTYKTDLLPVRNSGGNALKDTLSDLKEAQENISAVMEHFRLYRMGYADPVPAIHDMLRMAEEQGLLTEPGQIWDKLREREEMGGLGIPGTAMGLYHCKHEKVRTLIFQITHLETPSVVKGMDGTEMQMKSILLMLAPEKLSPRAEEIISLISTILIETRESIMIFSSGNEKMMKNCLESAFLEYLYTNLLKG